VFKFIELLLTLVLLAENRGMLTCIPSFDRNVHDRPLSGKTEEGKEHETEI